jgi:RNA polymerase sigma-70 factor (ECF subfamily)
VEQAHPTRLFALAADNVDAQVVAGFRRACESHLSAVYAYVCYRVRDAEVAEELTSAVFLKALERLPTFDPTRGEMRNWIFRIARNLVTDHLRTQRRWAMIPIEWLSERRAAEVTPEAALAQSEVLHRLIGGLKRLRHRDRDLLGMKFGADLTNRDIAQVTGLTEGHVSVLLRRALDRLKMDLKSHGVSHA